MRYLTTHEAKRPCPAIRSGRGHLLRRVIPNEAAHVLGHVPLGHDAIADNGLKVLSAHVLNIACDESGGPYVQAAGGRNNNRSTATRSDVICANGTPWASGYTSILPAQASACLNYPRCLGIEGPFQGA